jgi:4'-phosphopantetheinyl transferase
MGFMAALTPKTCLIDLPRAGVVDVWRVRLDVDPDRYARRLDGSDWQRASRQRGCERRRFVVSHGALRTIAARYTCAKLVTAYGEPPRCAGVELSLAHADEVALVAVAAAPVGIDVEPVASVPEDELDGLADFVLGDRERAAYGNLPRGERAAALLRAWTRKEAYLKACGHGIGDRSLADVEVTLDRRHAAVVRAAGDDVSNVTLVHLEPADGYVGAVAIRYPGGEVRWRS